MSLFVQALLVAAFVTVVFIDSHTTQTRIFRPVVVGPVVGLVMGDVQTGFTVSITVELMFLAVIFADTVVPPNPIINTATTTGIATLDGGGTNLAVVTALPVSFIGRMAETFQNSAVNAHLMHHAERVAEHLGTRGIAANNLIFPMTANALLYGVPTFLVIYFGASCVQTIINAIPAEVVTGLSVGDNMIGMIGFVLLLNSVKVEKFWSFFLLGFFMAAYLNINTIGVVFLAVTYVAMYYYFKIADVSARLGKGRRAI